MRGTRFLRPDRLALLGAALLALAAAAPAEAQPGLRGRRPPEGQRPQPQQQRPQADTVPQDSTQRPVVQDSIIDQLLLIPGYEAVEYQGDSAQFNNRERTLRLRGSPVVSRAGMRLQARDSIVYREGTEFVEVYGSPQATGEGQDITGDVMFYDLAARRASVRGAKTTITEGATWFVEGNVTSEEQGVQVYATSSTFTSDDREEPAYYFKAERIKVIKNRVLVGRPALLYFRNVPVFWLPFIVQDLAEGRRSGVLIPEFEINDIVRTDQRGRGTRGTGRQISNVGYYWAINDYMGALAALDWRSQQWISVQMGYQFNWRRKFMNGNAQLQRFWREGGVNSFTLRGSGSWKPNERTDISTSLNYASSTQFERNRQVDPFRQISDISSTASFSRKFDWGQVSSGGELRQTLSNDDRELRTRLSISPQTITLFASPEEREPAWYNDGSLTLAADGSLNRSQPGEALLRRQQPTQEENVSLTSNIRLGPVSVGGGARYGRQARSELAALADSADAIGSPRPAALAFLPGSGAQTVDWNAGTGYEFRLIGATRLTPSISVGQQMVRRDTAFEGGVMPDTLDERRWGQWVAGQPRVSLSTGLQTELFGFFPGFGSYAAVRHHLRPGLSYRYSPGVRQDTVQNLVLGFQSGRKINEVTFNLDQTFEAKLRDPRDRSSTDQAAERAGTGNPQGAGLANRGAQTDSARAGQTPGDPVQRDTAGADSAGGREGEPRQDRKITLLSINTSALAYSFVPVDTLGTRFTTPDITNRIRSDLFGGLNFTISHDLFDERRGETGAVAAGPRRFSPFLTGVQTSLSFGASSALFRWLGFARATEGERATERGNTPPEQGVPTVDPPGSQTQTNSPLGSGGGANWNVQLNYSLRRTRPLLSDAPAQRDRGNQQLSGNVSFMPTRNWAVSWYTDYSITENKFGTHVLNFKRDLYRWQANFDFTRAPNGNTSFSFSVHLTDLPDLKADYNRSDLGADRENGPE